MRRVLVLAYDFPPIASASAQRMGQLVRNLPAHGWRPLVVTPRTGTSWAHDPETAAGLPREVGVLRTGSLEPARILGRLRRPAAGGDGAGSGPVVERLREWLLIPDARAGWIPFALAAASSLLRKADALLTADPHSAHVAGIALRAIGRRPWVADFHDPWSLPSYKRWRGGWRPRVDARLERAVLTRADRVVASTGWLGEYLARRGAGERVRVVPNGYDPSEIPATVGPDHAFTVLHPGSFYGPRSPEPLLAAAAAAIGIEPALRAALRLRLRDWQDRGNAARLDAAARRLGLDGVVERVPPVARREAMAAMRAAAVLAVVTDPVEGGRGLIPLKLYECLAGGRQVLVLAPPEGETGRLARAAGATVVHPADVGGAAAALLRLFGAWRAGRNGWAPDRTVLERFRWDRLAGDLAAVLDEAVREQR